MNNKMNKRIKINGFPEPSGEDEYLCRGCTSKEFIVKTYWVFEDSIRIGGQFRRIQTDVKSGALICATCGHSARIDITSSITLPTKAELKAMNEAQ